MDESQTRREIKNNIGTSGNCEDTIKSVTPNSIVITVFRSYYISYKVDSDWVILQFFALFICLLVP